MDQLTSDLRGVAVYIDDILVSGTTASEHLQNLRALLQRLESKGLHCHLKKCVFRTTMCGVPWSHPVRSADCQRSKGERCHADACTRKCLWCTIIPLVSSSKFLPNLAMLTEPLHRLTKKDTPWRSKLPSKRSRIYFVKTTFLSTSIHLSRLGSLVMPGQQRSLERY